VEGIHLHPCEKNYLGNPKCPAVYLWDVHSHFGKFRLKISVWFHCSSRFTENGDKPFMESIYIALRGRLGATGGLLELGKWEVMCIA
jgi:hypothetical protein